jgi:putative holliday junction resolvase
MGLDVGSRRIGVAVSDDLRLTAQPLLTVVRKKPRDDVRSVARLVRRYECTEIVVGNPLHMSGEQSRQAEKTQVFAQAVADETGLPVHLWDERLTTAEAHRILYEAGKPRAEHREVVDQVAAVIILQGFLDARKRGESSG